MDADEDALTWLGLCASEHDLRQKLNTCGDSKSPEFRETLRAWWGAIEALLEFHEREIARLGFARRNLPIQVLAALRGCAGYLAVGQIPGVVEGAATEGRRRVGPSERRDIGFAVSYHRAATGGIEHEDERIAIDDRSPVKTIMEAFGASRTTVQGWMSKIRPAFLGVNPINDEVLTTLMKEAGERYKNAGRSHGAILSRASLDDLVLPLRPIPRPEPKEPPKPKISNREWLWDEFLQTKGLVTYRGSDGERLRRDASIEGMCLSDLIALELTRSEERLIREEFDKLWRFKGAVATPRELMELDNDAALNGGEQTPAPVTPAPIADRRDAVRRAFEQAKAKISEQDEARAPRAVRTDESADEGGQDPGKPATDRTRDPH